METYFDLLPVELNAVVVIRLSDYHDILNFDLVVNDMDVNTTSVVSKSKVDYNYLLRTVFSDLYEGMFKVLPHDKLYYNPGYKVHKNQMDPYIDLYASLIHGGWNQEGFIDSISSLEAVPSIIYRMLVAGRYPETYSKLQTLESFSKDLPTQMKFHHPVYYRNLDLGLPWSQIHLVAINGRILNGDPRNLMFKLMESVLLSQDAYLEILTILLNMEVSTELKSAVDGSVIRGMKRIHNWGFVICRLIYRFVSHEPPNGTLDESPEMRKRYLEAFKLFRRISLPRFQIQGLILFAVRYDNKEVAQSLMDEGSSEWLLDGDFWESFMTMTEDDNTKRKHYLKLFSKDSKSGTDMPH